MATNTIVVELFGFPGCGKTTLCSNIKEAKCIKVADFEDVLNDWSKATITHKLRSLPFLVICRCILFFLSTKILPSKNRRIYYDIIRRAILAKFAKQLSKYDFVFFDHGFLQGMHSFFYGHEKDLNKQSQCRIRRITESLSRYVGLHIYCQLPIDVTIQRLQSRNSSAHSRMDYLRHDYSRISSALEIQQKFFDQLFMIVSEAHGANIASISTAGTVNEMTAQLSTLIGIYR